MNSYLVTWAIDIDADSPEHAAALALMIQRDSDSGATHFTVTDAAGIAREVWAEPDYEEA